MSKEARWGFVVATYFWQNPAPHVVTVEFSPVLSLLPLLLISSLYLNYEKVENKTNKQTNKLENKVQNEEQTFFSRENSSRVYLS